MPSAITAADCVFLISIPLHQASFGQALARGSSFLIGNGFKEEADWNKYSVTASAVLYLADEIARLGGRVIFDAGLPDLSGAVEQYPVVGLLAHCEFSPIERDEVLDREEFLRVVTLGEQDELRMLREHSAELTFEMLIEGANTLCGLTHLDYDAERTVQGGQFYRGLGDFQFGLTRFDRARIEEILGPSVLRPGRAIELSDSTWSAWDIIAAIPCQVRRILDLSLCRSVVLGSAIRRHRPQVTPLVGRKRLSADVAVMLWKLHLVELARARRKRRPISYEEAVVRTVDAIANRKRV